ncbi:MAG: DnaJ domain-containing protein [Calditrichae bacterium]|nr:DnaJ domain-containing protein [Calditrichia bacterium]
MSLVSRVFSIFRSYLNLRPEINPSSTGSYDEEYRRRERRWDQQANDSTQASNFSRNSRTDYDPELAKYYANLEVPYGSDLPTVRQAWKGLLRKYHPDLHSNDPEKQQIANQLVQELNHAYEVLEGRLQSKDKFANK